MYGWVSSGSGAVEFPRTEFKFDDVCAFVIVSDAFMERYIALTGRDVMTNYFHMLHAGHIAYYILKFKNLY
jgi:hypothetical protein